MSEPFFTRNPHEHIARVYILGLPLLLVGLLFSPKALAALPFFALIALLFSWRAQQHFTERLVNPSLILFGFFLYLGVLWFFAREPELHLFQSAVIAFYTLPLFLLCFISLKQDHQTWQRSLAFVTVAAFFLGASQILHNNFNLFDFSIDHLNQTTFQITAVLLCMIVFFIQRRCYTLSVLLCGLMSIMLLSSYSLTTQVASFFALSVFALSFYFEKLTRKLLAPTIFLTSLLLPLLLSLVFPYLQKINFGANDLTYSARLEIWEKALTALFSGDIFGHGLHAIRQFKHSSGAPIQHLHNLSLQIWYDLGIFGFLWLATVCWQLHIFLQKCAKPTAQLVILAVTYFFVAANFEYALWHEWLISAYFFVTVLIVMLVHMPQELHLKLALR